MTVINGRLDASQRREAALEKDLSAVLSNNQEVAAHNATLRGLLQQILVEAQDLKSATESAQMTHHPADHEDTSLTTCDPMQLLQQSRAIQQHQPDENQHEGPEPVPAQPMSVPADLRQAAMPAESENRMGQHTLLYCPSLPARPDDLTAGQMPSSSISQPQDVSHPQSPDDTNTAHQDQCEGGHDQSCSSPHPRHSLDARSGQQAEQLHVHALGQPPKAGLTCPRVGREISRMSINENAADWTRMACQAPLDNTLHAAADSMGVPTAPTSISAAGIGQAVSRLQPACDPPGAALSVPVPTTGASGTTTPTEQAMSCTRPANRLLAPSHSTPRQALGPRGSAAPIRQATSPVQPAHHLHFPVAQASSSTAATKQAVHPSQTAHCLPALPDSMPMPAASISGSITPAEQGTHPTQPAIQGQAAEISPAAQGPQSSGTPDPIDDSPPVISTFKQAFGFSPLCQTPTNDQNPRQSAVQTPPGADPQSSQCQHKMSPRCNRNRRPAGVMPQQRRQMLADQGTPPQGPTSSTHERHRESESGSQGRGSAGSNATRDMILGLHGKHAPVVSRSPGTTAASSKGDSSGTSVHRRIHTACM